MPSKETIELEKLRRFKAYVHKRLDDAGVPVDPESPHKAEGCRIGGRLDWVLKRAVNYDGLVEALTEIAYGNPCNCKEGYGFCQCTGNLARSTLAALSPEPQAKKE